MKKKTIFFLITFIISTPLTAYPENETAYHQRGVLIEEKIVLRDIPPDNGPVRIWLPYPQSNK